MFKKKVSEKKLKKWVEKKSWKGNGTKESPFEIFDANKFPYRVDLKNINSFIHISGCKFKYLILTLCQNINIEKCKIKGISLNYCNNITIQNNKIRKISLFQSMGNSIKDNQFLVNNIETLKKSRNSYPFFELILFLAGMTVGLVSLLFFAYPFITQLSIWAFFAIIVIDIVLESILFNYLKLIPKVKLYKKTRYLPNDFSNNKLLIQTASQ